VGSADKVWSVKRRIPKGWPRDRVRRHRLTNVYGLDFDRTWVVGLATFEPAGRLRRDLEAARRRSWKRHRDDAHLQADLERIAMEFGEAQWATASALGIDSIEAEGKVRDAIAVLRLYARSMTNLNLDHQTFGLAPDVGSTVARSYVISRGRIVQSGLRVAGIPGTGWRFTEDRIDAFADQPDFAWLDAALRAAERTDLQKRAAMALRFLNLATSMLPGPVRVVLIATAFEELLGDETAKDRRHRAARRYAFLTCAKEFGQGYAAGERPACAYLAARSADDAKRLHQSLAQTGHRPRCSWFEEARALFDLRDLVLHERLDTLPKNAAVQFEAVADLAIRGLAEWAATNGSTSIDELDEAIDAHVLATARELIGPP
jgi:hypothetical protein